MKQNQTLTVKGGDTIAAALGLAFNAPGLHSATITGELVPVAACTKRGTVKLGLETLAAALVCTGAVQPAALRLAIETAVRWDNGLEPRKGEQVKALIDDIKNAVAANVPPIEQAASWRLANGVLVPTGAN